MGADRTVRFGMVGGGQGAFIGEVHRLAARLDGRLELVCGAFSRDPDNSKTTGQMLGLPDSRVYENFQDMMRGEAELPASERMEFVSIVTPNHVHFPVAKAALEAGFPVLSDKPATKDLDEVLQIKALAEKTGLQYALTHTYLGYPLVSYARELVRGGELGAIRKIFDEYIQGWLATDVNNKQADWRTDPTRSGKSGCMGDIGTHAHNLAEFVSGRRMTHVAADLSIFGPGRMLDDDGSALFRMEDNVKGVLSASQICVGCENSLSIRIYGEKGGLSWAQESPNQMQRTYLDRPTETITSGQGYLPESIQDMYRTPPGHPEGYLEAFANIYLEFAAALQGDGELSASVDSAVRGMAFIDALVESQANNSAWTEIEA
jgi:predicted dehydrogenase